MKRALLSLLPSVVATLIVSTMLVHIQAADRRLSGDLDAYRAGKGPVEPACERYAPAGIGVRDRCL